MAFLRCDFFSEALQMETSFQLVFPDKEDLKSLPVVYLLHGLSDNATCWQRRVPVERYAQRYKVAVVMPEVQRSWYTDMAEGLAYFRYIHRELPDFCQRVFGVSKKREQNYVMGLSMGGYGAMKCALTQPFRYGGCASFSGALRVDTRYTRYVDNPQMMREWAAITGHKDGTLGPVADLRKLAAKAAGKAGLPRLYITCGAEDFLLDANHSFVETLGELGIPHDYEEWPGAHTWEFWNTSLEKAFERFFAASRR